MRATMDVGSLFSAGPGIQRLLVSALIAGSLVGCGKKRLAVVPVRGQVLYEGRGVSGATVIFHPQSNVPDEAQQMRPYAFADADGHFELKTYVDGDGVPPGDYRVSIAFAGAGTSLRHTDGAPADPAATANKPLSIPLGIRKKYSSVDTAGVTVTIQEGVNELEPIQLK